MHLEFGHPRLFVFAHKAPPWNVSFGDVASSYTVAMLLV